MARLKAGWNLKDRVRGVEDIASAVGANIWKIAGDRLLSLENEGFETVSSAQRLDVIAEFAAFLVHMTDRMVYDDLDESQRQAFITALGLRLTHLMQDNRIDANGPGDYREAFVGFLNDRTCEYAQCTFSKQEGPGFGLRRILGEHVRSRMGAKDNKWIPDYVMDREAPMAVGDLKRALAGLVDDEPALHRPPIPKDGVWGEG
jgi:hypothetical protein